MQKKKSPDNFQDLIQHHTKREIISLYFFDYICKNAFINKCMGGNENMIPICFSAFLEVTNLHIDHLNWQVRIGGLCWLIKTLRWLVYGGKDIIPGSEAWIPDLLNDVENLCEELITDSQSY
ncbi:hypothetical protein B9T62_38050 [Paenibacillus donghaensis]|uniref:Uncharacterized protein n=2 Tax=Paenibacillus donghaensis TaxID=414771 RepID=A0A2Z2KJ73_9BACL|nr:hypothetical protein B9T62_38050 [Paenibacillus donghaensis]